MIEAKWPESQHIAPVPISAGDTHVLINGRPPRFKIRILTEDEYQLLLAGFKTAGGIVEQVL